MTVTDEVREVTEDDTEEVGPSEGEITCVDEYKPIVAVTRDDVSTLKTGVCEATALAANDMIPVIPPGEDGGDALPLPKRALPLALALLLLIATLEAAFWALGEYIGVFDIESVEMGVLELLGETLWLAPVERDDVGDDVVVIDDVRVPETVERGVKVVVADGDIVGLGVHVALDVTLALAPLESDAVGEEVNEEGGTPGVVCE